MIEKTLKTTTGKLTVSIPGNLTEVTLGQMIALQEKTDLTDMDAISFLSGVPVTELNNVSNVAGFQAFTDSIMLLSQQLIYLFSITDIPQSIIFSTGSKSTKVKVSKNLSVEPAGAYFAARDVIVDEINRAIKQYGEENWQQNFNPSLKACSQVLAQYFFCRATGKPYNEYQAEEFIAEIKKLRVTEALPIARHFFTSFPNLSKPKTSYFHRLQQRWRKKLESMLLKNLNMSTP